MLAQSAARAGFTVDAVDLFGDIDTREIAERVLTVRAESIGFDAPSLASAVAKLANQAKPDFFVYGSGFEAAPELLDQCFGDLSLVGNSADVVRAVKDPKHVIEALRREGISTPPVQVSGTVREGSWLMKRIGASGGHHVRASEPGETVPEGCYVQQRVTGRSMSALLLSNGISCELLGLCEHWCAQPELLMPYQHSGIVRVDEAESLSAAIAEWGERCAQRFGLCGIWGMDFIVDEHAQPQLIEINPRPPASFQLFDSDGRLFNAHVVACGGQVMAPQLATGSMAAVVYYAHRNLRLPQKFPWPEWTADRTGGCTLVEYGQPFCTVLSRGLNSISARRLADSAVSDLQSLLDEATK